MPLPPGQFPQYQAVGKVRVDPRNSNNVVAGTKTGLYFSYSQSSLAALFVAVLAVSAIAGSRGVRRTVAAVTARDSRTGVSGRAST